MTKYDRLKRARHRIMPLCTPGGVRMGYLVRSKRPGRMPLGPFYTEDEAVKAALEEPEDIVEQPKHKEKEHNAEEIKPNRGGDD